ncbi:MAG TPA: hypothetical protein VFO82_03785, partial [Steroidobacteraceae bacterium]|nr:hypothetical protein [Steroidobacteraceae bacterium]
IASPAGWPGRLGYRIKGSGLPVRRLPVRSECADAVIVMDAFGFFDTEVEHDAILREDARVLMTGGRLTVVLNWPPGKPKKRSLAL